MYEYRREHSPPDSSPGPTEAEARERDDLTLLDPLVKWVQRKRLETPATLFLEMNRPLMPLAFPAAMFFSGFLAPLVGPDFHEKAEALRDPTLLDRVLARLRETGEKDAPDAQTGVAD